MPDMQALYRKQYSDLVGGCKLMYSNGAAGIVIGLWHSLPLVS